MSAATVEQKSSAGPVALLVAIVLLTAAAVPYLIAARITPPSRVYTGLAAWPADQCSYLMWMRQARDGGPYYDLMTSDPHPPLIPPLFWVALGRLSALTGMGLVPVYHLARLLLAAAYLFMLWRALSLWVERPAVRVAIYIAIAGGSGLGWLARLLRTDAMPVDQAMPELWSFSSFLYYPHFTASLLFLTAVMYSLYQLWWTKPSPRPWAWLLLSCSALAIAVVHPYTFVPLAATLTLFLFVPSEHARAPLKARAAALSSLAPGAAFMLYLRAAAASHPVLSQWMAQNRLPSPSPLGYLQGFGVIGVVAAFLIVANLASAMSRDRSAARALGLPLLDGRSPDPVTAFAFVWVLSAFALAYAFPIVPFARRCVEAAHIFLCLLAGSALGGRLTDLAARRGVWVVAGMVAVILWPMSIVLAVDAAGPSAVTVPAPVAQAWEFIDQHTPPDAAIFCTATDGQFIPPFAGRRVFVGHFHLTPDYRLRVRQAAKFFSPTTDNVWRQRALAASHCGYVLARDVAPSVARDLANMLGQPVFARGHVVLYRVR